MFSRYFK